MLTSVSCVLFYFRHSTTVLGDIYWDASTSKISARVNGSIVGTSTRTFSYSTWYLIESYYNVSDTGDFNMRFDGDQEITYSGDTKPGADTHIDNIMDGFAENWHFYVDDIAVNDTNGTVDNSWCGDGHIEKITPSGSGVQNEFLNSGSVSGSANYLYVDEYPNDGVTTYVYCSGSNTGFQDQYARSNISLTGRVITRIYAESRAKKTLGQPLSMMRATWPGWVVYMATLAGKLGAYVVAYRNPDWRTYEEARNPDFAEWARGEEWRRQFDDAERSGAADDDANEVTHYVRCCKLREQADRPGCVHRTERGLTCAATVIPKTGAAT